MFINDLLTTNATTETTKLNLTTNLSISQILRKNNITTTHKNQNLLMIFNLRLISNKILCLGFYLKIGNLSIVKF